MLPARIASKHFLTFLFGVSLLTAILSYAWVATGDRHVPVLLVSRDLQPPTRLHPADLTLVMRPAAAVHERAVRDLNQAVGRYLKVPVVEGQELLETHLAEDRAGGPLPSRLRAGEVALFIPLPLQRSLGGAIAPDDEIDLVLVASGSYGAAGPARVLVRGARVLEVRDEYGRPYETEEQRSGPSLLGVNVAVGPYDAARLVFALEHGTLYAVMNPNDLPDAGPVTWDNVFPLHTDDHFPLPPRAFRESDFPVESDLMEEPEFEESSVFEETEGAFR